MYLLSAVLAFLTDAQGQTLITVVGVFMGVLVTTLGTIAVAKINGRADRLRADLGKLNERLEHAERKYEELESAYASSVDENVAWRDWARRVIALLPDGVKAKLPPRPHYRRYRPDVIGGFGLALDPDDDSDDSSVTRPL